jgi:hypothetical protein
LDLAGRSGGDIARHVTLGEGVDTVLREFRGHSVSPKSMDACFDASRFQARF